MQLFFVANCPSPIKPSKEDKVQICKSLACWNYPKSGSRKGGKDLDPFLEVLVDEIIFLCGCKLYDSYRKAPFQAKVEIMIYILDYQGLGKVFCLTGTGSYRGCGWCMQKGQYCKHLCKVVYPGNRRFLPTGHQLRKDTRNFPERSEEK